MTTTTFKPKISWTCKNTWKKASYNTSWCLLGCAIGDFGTILFFQLTKISFPVLWIMLLAIFNGLITSIILETIVLMNQKFNFSLALKTALSMSFFLLSCYDGVNNRVEFFERFIFWPLDVSRNQNRSM